MGYRELQKFNSSQFSDSPTTAGGKAPVAPVVNTPFRIRDRDLGSRPNQNAFERTSGDYLHKEYNEAVFNPFASDYFNAKFLGMDFGSVTDEHKDTTFGLDPYSRAVDFEHVRRNAQGKLSAAAGLAGQFVGKTAVNTAGGIIGGFYSLGAAVINRDSSLLFDNSVNRALDKANEWMDENNSVFTSQVGRANAPLGLFSIEGLKDVSDAYSFIAGAVASELIIDGLSFGVGLAGAPARLTRLAGSAVGKGKKAIGLGRNIGKSGNYFSRAEEVAGLFGKVDLNDTKRLESLGQQFGVSVDDIVRTKKSMDRANEIALRGRKLVTGTFWEGGLEARQTKDAIMEDKEKDLQAALEVMDFDSEEEKELFEAKERLKIKDMADTAGFVTFGLNAGLLNASNVVQFPTIFGKKALKDLNKNSRRVVRDGLGKVVERSGKMDAFRTFGVALKSSATEFLEETGQAAISASSKNYYETSLGTRSATGELMPGTASIADALKVGLEQAYGTKEGLHEGMIGAIVGAIGLPMLKKNKKGKYRSIEFTGGVSEAFRGAKTRKEEYEKAVEAAKMNEFGQLLTNAKDNAILSAIDGKKLDMAALNNDESAEEDIKNNMVQRYVNSKLEAGIEDHIAEDVKELENMSLEEYSKVFNKNDEDLLEEGEVTNPATAFTQEQKDKEVDDFKRKTEIYTQAYKTVYSGLRMDRINDNFVAKKYFDTLTHALSNEKLYRAQQLQLVDELLKRKDINMTREELLKLATLDGKFMNQRDEVNEYLSNLQQEKDEAFELELSKYKQKIEDIYNLAENESDKKLLDSLLEDSEDSEWSEKYLENVIKVSGSLKSKELRALAEKAPEFLKSKNKMKEAVANRDAYEKRRAKDTRIDKRRKPYREYKNRREALKELLKSISVDKGMEAGETLNQLRGKKDSVTQSELQEYFDLKEKAASVKIEQDTAKSVLDSLENETKEEESGSFEDIMDKLAGISKKQVLAMEIATNLYDQNNFSSGYNKMLKAIFLEDMSNLKLYNALTEALISQLDDENASEMLAIMKMAVKNIEKNLEEEKKGLNDEFIKQLEDLIKESKENIKKIEESIEIEDSKADAKENTLRKNQQKAESKVNDVLDAKEIAKKEEEEALKNLNKKVARKPTWTIRGSKTSKVKDVAEFNEKLESGEIKYNSAARLSHNEAMEDNDFNAYLDKLKIKEVYYKGKEMVMADKSTLIPSIEDLAPEVVIYITHLPVKTKFYDANVEYIEGEQISGISEDSKVVSEMFLFSPDLTAKNKKEIYADFKPKYDKIKLEYDTAMAAITAKYEASEKTDKDLASFKKKEEGILRKWTDKKEEYKAATSSMVANANDEVVFELRREMALTRDTEDEGKVDLRVGVIYEGRLEKASDTNMDIEENGLITSIDNPDGLSDDRNKVDETKILMGTQTGEYIDMNGDTVTLNGSSVIQHKKAMNGRLYYVYETVNGQKIPVILNRSYMGKNEELLDEVLHQIREFLINKRPDDKIKLKNKKFKFLEGNSENESKTFEEFFKTFFDKNNSGPREDKTLATLDIDKKNLVLFLGNMTESLVDVDQFDKNFRAIKESLGKMRYYLDRKSFTKNDGSFNREMFDFILDNKMINHSFNTTKNRDKIFVQEDDFVKSIGVHSLNYKGPIKAKEVKASRVDKVTEEIYKVFGLTTKVVKSKNVKDRVNLSLNRAYWLFNESVIKIANRKIKENFGAKDAKDKPTLIIEAFNEAMEAYLDKMDELALLAPYLSTEGAKERIMAGKALKTDNKFIDNTYKIAKHYLDKVIGSRDFMEAILSITETGNYDVEFKKDLTNPTTPLVSLGSTEYGPIYNKSDVKNTGGGNGLIFKLPEALTEGTKSENERKTKNLVKSFVLLRDSVRIFHPKNFEKHGLKKDDKTNRKFIYIDFATKFFNNGKTISKSYKNNVDSTGVTATNYKEEQGDNSLFHSASNEAVQFYIETEDGDFELTNNPEEDFKFDENGVLLNGLVTMTFTSNRKGANGNIQSIGSRKIALSGTDNNPNSLPGVNTITGFVSSIKLPGLTSDFELDMPAVESFENKIIKFSNNYSRLNQATSSKSPINKELGVPVELQEDVADPSAVDALGATLMNNLGVSKPKPKTPSSTKDVEDAEIVDDPNPFSSPAQDEGTDAATLAALFNGAELAPTVSTGGKIMASKLTPTDVIKLQENASAIIANIGDYEAVLDSKQLDKSKVESMLYESLKGYNINNYENFIESIQYLFVNNDEGLKKTLNFVNKLTGKNLNKDNFNNCLK